MTSFFFAILSSSEAAGHLLGHDRRWSLLKSGLLKGSPACPPACPLLLLPSTEPVMCAHYGEMVMEARRTGSPWRVLDPATCAIRTSHARLAPRKLVGL